MFQFIKNSPIISLNIAICKIKNTLIIHYQKLKIFLAFPPILSYI